MPISPGTLGTDLSGSEPRTTTVTTLTTRLIDGGLDLGVWWFAAWTVIYHAALWWDLSQSVAIAAWAVAGIAVVVALVRLETKPDLSAAAPGRPMPRALWWGSLGAAAVAALLMAGRILVPPGWYAAWALAIAGVAPAAVWSLWAARRDARPPRTDDTRRSGPSPFGVVLVVVIALAFGLLAMFTRRPDSDDSFLVNRSLYAQEHADGFATGDTMFGDEEVDSVRPDVAPSSIEPLIGVIGRLGGVPAQTLTYLVLGPVIAAAGIVAAWRLIRTLRVRAPALVTAATAGFLLLDGVRHQSFGNFSLARSWQGKVILVFLIVPVLWHYALAWSRDRSPSAAVGLVAANVAAVGLTSTGLVVAPAVSVLGVLAGDPRRVARSLPVLGAALLYPLGALLLGSDTGLVLGASVAELASGSIVGRAASPEGGPISEGASFSWYLVLGSGIPMGVAAASILGSWATVRDAAARRALLLAPIAVLPFFGPGLHRLFLTEFSADAVYWRVLWIAPVPVMVGLAVTSGLRWVLTRSGSERTAVRWTAAVALPLVVATGLWFRGAPVLVETNLDLWVFDWDVDPARRAAAQRAIDLSEPGDVVAAPVAVGQPMPLLSVDVRPVNPEDRFTFGGHATPAFDAPGRALVSRTLESGLAPGTAGAFRAALDDLSVDTVCLTPRLLVVGDPVEAELADAGFVVVETTPTCVYWRR